MTGMGWLRRAECATADPSLFDHPADGERPTVAQQATADAAISAHCDWCPVRVQCLTQALADERDGIAGGQLITNRHGTLAGYNQYHRRVGADPCAPCREAKNAYYREYRAAVRARAAA